MFWSASIVRIWHTEGIVSMCGSRGETRGPAPTPPWKPQKYRVSLQYWSGSPEKSRSYKATKPAFNVWLSSACQRNAILPASETPFKWRFAGGSMMTSFKCYLALVNTILVLFNKKNVIRIGPRLAKLSGSRMVSSSEEAALIVDNVDMQEPYINGLDRDSAWRVL